MLSHQLVQLSLRTRVANRCYKSFVSSLLCSIPDVLSTYAPTQGESSNRYSYWRDENAADRSRSMEKVENDFNFDKFTRALCEISNWNAMVTIVGNESLVVFLAKCTAFSYYSSIASLAKKQMTHTQYRSSNSFCGAVNSCALIKWHAVVTASASFSIFLPFDLGRVFSAYGRCNATAAILVLLKLQIEDERLRLRELELKQISFRCTYILRNSQCRHIDHSFQTF